MRQNNDRERWLRPKMDLLLFAPALLLLVVLLLKVAA